ncbi:hypothetical protein DUK53_16085 [Listeria sp. SHR_NRA_18]|uniref:hypothetical protein n=1 Tax=Listeria TaxID=1637 RepID=UPI00051DDA40|nr:MULTISPECIES: hypothetical protein [Listeria]KGL44493.1 hypothetical protein EP56_07790 [Listeriaceae bacterium FSL A5-0209]KGL45692.1 hypothetical protein EP58_03090 [Listeria newyorkensis]RQW65470.1 hypothetical protein DUK53_16085 [Listeria sp. SHR_NRA_18]SQC55378.1 Uncharacterised protein [Listeria newyorkensis]
MAFDNEIMNNGGFGGGGLGGLGGGGLLGGLLLGALFGGNVLGNKNADVATKDFVLDQATNTSIQNLASNQTNGFQEVTEAITSGNYATNSTLTQGFNSIAMQANQNTQAILDSIKDGQISNLQTQLAEANSKATAAESAGYITNQINNTNAQYREQDTLSAILGAVKCDNGYGRGYGGYCGPQSYPQPYPVPYPVDFHHGHHGHHGHQGQQNGSND